MREAPVYISQVTQADLFYCDVSVYGNMRPHNRGGVVLKGKRASGIQRVQPKRSLLHHRLVKHRAR